MKTIKPFPDDIVASGPWVEGPEYYGLRVVLRDLGRQYVVHTQCQEGASVTSFNDGHYFPKRDSPDNTLSDAFSCFVVRSIRLIGAREADVIRRMAESVVMDEVVRRGMVQFNPI